MAVEDVPSGVAGEPGDHLNLLVGAEIDRVLPAGVVRPGGLRLREMT
jgi:hypothetical protein